MFGGKLSSIRSRKDGAVKQVSSFLSLLDQAHRDAEKTKQEIDEVRGELDDIEAEADRVLEFIEEMPAFGGEA